MGNKLTKEQQNFVAENHNLIYKFLNEMNLPDEKYYDLAAIGLCRAGIIYNNSKGTFSTLAFKCMKNEICRYWQHKSRKYIIPSDKIISYDYEVSSDDFYDKVDFLDFIFNEVSNEPFNEYENIINKVAIEEMQNELNAKEKTILKMLYSGLECKEIAKELSCTVQGVRYYIGKIRKKCRKYI